MTPPLSHDGLHIILWEKRTGAGTVRIQQNALCGELMITKYTLNRALKAMELSGRIRPLTKSLGATVRTYEIMDPERYFAER